ncbi:MAG: hypothetical protein L0215_04225 [Gemmataceae bacterium]|nr:hypothetical protein [Gemmataceae bacterium]
MKPWLMFTAFLGVALALPAVWAQDQPGEAKARAIRVLYVKLADNQPDVKRDEETPVIARLRKLKFDVVVAPWSKFDPERAKDIDVIFLPTGWAGVETIYQGIEAKRDAIHKFVERGHGLLVCQPNPNHFQDGTCTPSVMPFPITFQAHYDKTEPARVNLAHDHFITEDLADNDMPFPFDPIKEIDNRYRVLAKQKSTGSPSLAVCSFGDGRIVVQTSNENYGAIFPISDTILTRMIVWAAGREPKRR